MTENLFYGQIIGGILWTREIGTCLAIPSINKTFVKTRLTSLSSRMIDLHQCIDIETFRCNKVKLTYRLCHLYGISRDYLYKADH